MAGGTDFISSIMGVFGGGSNTVPSSNSTQLGNGKFSFDTNFASSLINAGTSLAGIFFNKQSEDKQRRQQLEDEQRAFEQQKALIAMRQGGDSSMQKQALMQRAYEDYIQSIQAGGATNSGALSRVSAGIGNAIGRRS